MDGRAYLERLINHKLDDLREHPGNADRVLNQVHGVADGLRAAGALSDRVAAELLHELTDSLDRDGLITMTRHEFSASTTVVTPPPAPDEDPVTDVPRLPRSAAGPIPPSLHAVIPLAGRTVTLGGITHTLVSLELWSGGTVLRLARPCRETVRGEFPLQWRASDDVGTRYVGCGGGASGTREWIFERKDFEPGVPPEAGEFTVEVDGLDTPVRVDISLRG